MELNIFPHAVDPRREKLFKRLIRSGKIVQTLDSQREKLFKGLIRNGKKCLHTNEKVSEVGSQEEKVFTYE
jgi:hypothetical protein